MGNQLFACTSEASGIGPARTIGCHTHRVPSSVQPCAALASVCARISPTSWWPNAAWMQSKYGSGPLAPLTPAAADRVGTDHSLRYACRLVP